jgi:hypothetical protein
MCSKPNILFLVFFSLLSSVSFAQTDKAEHKINVTIPEVALLGLVSETDKAVSMQPMMATEAGEAVVLNKISSSRIWVNYSSIISEATPSRKVVAVIQGELPKGLTLKVAASAFTGSGKGKLGTPAGLVTLSNQPTDVIVDIGSCYTGKGINNGHYLTYQLEKEDDEKAYAMLSAQNTAVNVVYTLTDYR